MGGALSFNFVVMKHEDPSSIKVLLTTEKRFASIFQEAKGLLGGSFVLALKQLSCGMELLTNAVKVPTVGVFSLKL